VDKEALKRQQKQ